MSSRLAVRTDIHRHDRGINPISAQYETAGGKCGPGSLSIREPIGVNRVTTSEAQALPLHSTAKLPRTR